MPVGKFKVGDKVKVLDPQDWAYANCVGRTGLVIEAVLRANPQMYSVRLDCMSADEWLKLHPQQKDKDGKLLPVEEGNEPGAIGCVYEESIELLA